MKCVFKLKCDACQEEFESHAQSVRTRVFHFCNLKCSNDARKPGGVLAAKFAATCMERYGRPTPRAPRKVHEKLSKELRAEKCRQSLVIGRQRLCEKYGVDNVAQIASVRKKLSQREKSPEAIAKAKTTLQERYGVTCSFQIPSVRANSHTPEANFKRVQQWLKTACKVSRAEVKLLAALQAKFGADNVQTQVIMNNRWPIDIYIRHNDTYVQVDGVYWHGLDRPLEVIKQLKSRHDKAILGKRKIDARQNEWFAKNSLKLIRVTDRDVLRDVDEVVRRIANHDHD